MKVVLETKVIQVIQEGVAGYVGVAMAQDFKI